MKIGLLRETRFTCKTNRKEDQNFPRYPKNVLKCNKYTIYDRYRNTVDCNYEIAWDNSQNNTSCAVITNENIVMVIKEI